VVAADWQSAYFLRTYLAGLALSMAAPDHEFDSRIHVDSYDCLAEMSSGPDAQQLIDEALTDVIDSSEVNLDGLKIRLQTIEKAPCFAARHKSGADLKQFDHKTSPDQSVVLSEFAEYVGDHVVGVRVDLALN